jgi:alkyl hydroperoxide reductase subunit D
MNNVYYRFVHLVANPEYGTMPAKLRMNFIGSHGIPKEDFELFCIAVSAMNGCGMCIDSHERVLLEHGVKSDTIQSAVRIAAVIKALATVHSTL